MSRLLPGQMDLLARALEGTIDLDDPLKSVAAVFGPELARGLDPGSAAEIAVAVVRRAECDGIYETPPWLYKIADRLKDLADVAPIFAVLSPVPPPRPPMDAPLDSYRLDYGMPFVDRAELRKAVGKVVDPNGYGVLVVRGAHQSGKSYTADFATWVAGRTKHDATKRFSVALAAINPNDPTIWTPRFLVETLLANMGPPPDVPDQLPDSGFAHIAGLCNWLLGAVAPGDRWWWVVDGACAADVPEDTQKLLVELARRITTGSIRERARLILLDWPSELPGIPSGKIKQELLTDPDSIGDIDVRDFLGRLLAEVSDEASEATLDDLCAKVLADLPTGPTRLPALAHSIEQHTRALLEGAELI
jgi:hypothetical protein